MGVIAEGVGDGFLSVPYSILFAKPASRKEPAKVSLQSEA
jgi:hypothetical protein